LGRGRAITRNISASGVFFETDVDYAPGNEIIFAIELDAPAEQTLLLRCRGIIARVEHRAGKVGVGVELLRPKLE
jgi:Tfp pilus assembly protein PilZ